MRRQDETYAVECLLASETVPHINEIVIPVPKRLLRVRERMNYQSEVNMAVRVLVSTVGCPRASIGVQAVGPNLYHNSLDILGRGAPTIVPSWWWGLEVLNSSLI